MASAKSRERGFQPGLQPSDDECTPEMVSLRAGPTAAGNTDAVPGGQRRDPLLAGHGDAQPLSDAADVHGRILDGVHCVAPQCGLYFGRAVTKVDTTFF